MDAFEHVEAHEEDDRAALDAEYEIIQNANSEDFSEEASVIDAEAKEVAEQPVLKNEMTSEGMVDDEPDFMKA